MLFLPAVHVTLMGHFSEKFHFRVRRVLDGGQVASVSRDGQTLTFVVRGNLKPLSLECLSYFYGKKNNMDKKGGDRKC